MRWLLVTGVYERPGALATTWLLQPLNVVGVLGSGPPSSIGRKPVASAT